MPRLKGIKRVLVLGSGPIVIGQAAEFDYSGTQACKALKEEGIEVCLLNPNPATIMTDADMADRTYIEPLTVESVCQVFEKERPDGLIATMGGQAGLNLAVKLAEAGLLEEYGVRVLGTDVAAIRKGEDRDLFRETMREIGQPVPPSMIVTGMDQAEEALRVVGVPCVIRPAYTLGGTGGGFVNNIEEFKASLERGLLASPVHEVLVEASLYGQKEIEFEVIRDSAGNAIIVCSMENIDPMGIHTGDSIVVAPTLTLSGREHQMLRRAALDIVHGLGICGACNVQMALKPASSEYYVIEVNPRVSRSSALASKATGYPIARVATKIALGYNLDEIVNEVTKKTMACNEPVIDYVALKLPRWPWDKFSEGQKTLGLQMKSTGEVMAIGRTFQEALGKGISSLDQKNELWGRIGRLEDTPGYREQVVKGLKAGDDTRLMWIFRALAIGIAPSEVSSLTGIDKFFVERIATMVRVEKELINSGPSDRASVLRRAKELGLSDRRIAALWGVTEQDVREAREAARIRPVFKMVDTCAGEFEAETPYYYSTYESITEARPLDSDSRPKVVVLGGGPIRIGQGIEFDYCAVHAAWALEREGYASIIINNNPETVSTDFNTASRLYFEPLTFEHVMNVIDIEKPAGVLVGFGGQTAINLVDSLTKAGVRVLGTGPDAIDITEERGRFIALLHDLGIPAIQGTAVRTKEDALRASEIIGFPLVVRPSYVLGGRGMAIVYNRDELVQFMDEAMGENEGHDVLLDKYVLAVEAEVDVVSDGISAFVPAIIEHVERSGVHSGDSIAVIPSGRISSKAKTKIVEYSLALCRALRVKGIANIQFIVDGDTVYCLEVNPRASRTVPFVTKVTGFPIIRVATGLSLGRTLKSYGITAKCGPDPVRYAVKMPVFSWSKIPGVDPIVGPEMKSTGEVMGFGDTEDHAMLKCFDTQGIFRAGPAGALLTVADREKAQAVYVAEALSRAGWTLYATNGTAAYLEEHGIPAKRVLKFSESDNGQRGQGIHEVITQGKVQVVINIFTKGERAERDGFKIRALASSRNIPVLTCMDTSLAFAKAVASGAGAGLVALQDVLSSRVS
ncbi:MAG TPA: carbamoyl-phosphate synthase large subunit [Firmicutes bacterium]|nr:carbamoyl-phosphate synthase large subunit [Candidatus Fermentithermobacillaceae bacterium]